MHRHMPLHAFYIQHECMVLQNGGRLCRDGRIRKFVLQRKTYVYDWSAETFVPLPVMPNEIPLQVCRAHKALILINQGKPRLELAPCK